MTTEPMKADVRAGAVAAGHLVGQFRFEVATGRWWWSDETYQIHGFEPHDVVPTTALVLAHKHPEDREQVRQVLEQATVTGELFCSVHRIMDARGRERTIALVGEGEPGPVAGGPRELVGYFVDVSYATDKIADARATASIRASAANRATIEQAKGIIGFALGTSIDDAFGWLRNASIRLNVPLRELARTIVERSTRRDRDAAAITSTLRSMSDG